MPSDKRVRIDYAVFLAITLSFTLYEELHLRRWLFRHLGRNSVIAGSIPNFLAVLILVLASALMKLPRSKQEITRRIGSVVVGLCLYEVAQIWMPHQYFDWNDIAATLLGGMVVWPLLYLPLHLDASDEAATFQET